MATMTLDQMDPSILESLIKRVSIAPIRENPKKQQQRVMGKKELSSISNTVTSLRNVFNKIYVYDKNITHIHDMETDRLEEMGKEKKMESKRGGAITPSASAGGEGFASLTNLIPKLTSIVQDLTGNFEELDLSKSSSQPDIDINVGRKGKMSMPKMGKLGKGALIAGGATAVIGGGAMAYNALSGEDSSDPQVTPPATERESSVKRTGAPLKDTSRQTTDTLTKHAVKVVNSPGSSPTSTPVGGSEKGFASKFATFIGNTFRNVSSFVASLPSMISSGFTAVGDAASAFVEGLGGTDVPTPSGGDRWIMDMVKKHEGVKNKPYKDSRGLWTVGVGHLIGNGQSLPPEWNRTFSDAEVDQLFSKDFAHHKAGAMKVPGYDKANDLGKGAIIDLTFNMGPAWYKKFPATAAAMSQGNWGQAASGLQNSLWYKQVGNRAKTIVSMISKAGGNATMTGLASAAGSAIGGAVSGTISAVGSAASGFVDNVRDVAGGLMSFIRLASPSVNVQGLNPQVQRRMKAMAAEYQQRSGKKMQVNSGLRTRAEQAALFAKYGPGRAAPPGRSLHESGVAFDVNSTDGNALNNMGLLQKYGFWRPYAGKEPWHIEPVEGKRLGGGADNPYNPGAPAIVAAKGTQAAQLSPQGAKPIPQPRNASATTVAGDVAVQRRVTGTGTVQTNIAVNNCDCGPASEGGSVPSYLAGTAGPKAPPPQSNPGPKNQYLSYFGALVHT